MKKILMMMVVVGFFFINFDSYSWTQRKCSGGRDNGTGNPPTYDNVERYEDFWSVKITCKGSGSESCPKSIVAPGPEQDAVQNSEDYANAQINANNLNGNLFLTTTGLNVKWQAASSNPFSARQIITWKTTESEPSFTN